MPVPMSPASSTNKKNTFPKREFPRAYAVSARQGWCSTPLITVFSSFATKKKHCQRKKNNPIIIQGTCKVPIKPRHRTGTRPDRRERATGAPPPSPPRALVHPALRTRPSRRPSRGPRPQPPSSDSRTRALTAGHMDTCREHGVVRLSSASTHAHCGALSPPWLIHLCRSRFK